MKDKNTPAFQFYPKDLLSDANVVTMTNEELGAYWRLVCHCWIEGSLPSDDETLAKLSNQNRRWGHIRETVLRLFYLDGENRYCHKRLEVEKHKQLENKEKRKKAAESRWCKSNANALQVQCSSSSSSSSSSIASPDIDSTPKPPEGEEPDIPAESVKALPAECYAEYLDAQLEPFRDRTKIGELAGAYPLVDVPQSITEAKQWALTAAACKRPKAISRFINNWLKNEQHRRQFKQERGKGRESIPTPRPLPQAPNGRKPRPQEIPPDAANHAARWGEVIEILASEIDGELFAKYIAPAKCHGMNSGDVWIEAQDPNQERALNGLLGDQIAAAVRSVLGSKDLLELHVWSGGDQDDD